MSQAVRCFLENIGTLNDLQAGIHWSAREIGAEAQRRAAILGRAGVERGSIVIIAHGGSGTFFIDLLAVWLRGAIAACVHPALTASEFDNVTAFCQPKAVLVGTARPVPGNAKVAALDLATAAGSNRHVAMELAAEAIAVLLFTSGTTGRPKAVALSHAALAARIAANRAEIGDQTLQKTLLTLPTHFGHGLIGNSLTPLLSGGHLVIPQIGLGLAQQLATVIDDHEISFMTSVPSVWHFIVDRAPRAHKNTLRRVHVGSAPLSQPLWQKIAGWTGCPVWNCYGTTETSNWISGASSADGFHAGSVGRAWGVEVALRQEDGSVVRSGAGEILVQGASVMQGYWQRPDLTDQVFLDGWYRTGDIGEIDGGGNIRLVGREKDEINRLGTKVQPADIDLLLCSHPAVAEACCFGIHNEIASETVAVAVVFHKGISVTVDELKAWTQTRIRGEAVPETWFVVDRLPQTSNGKVSRNHVREVLAP